MDLYEILSIPPNSTNDEIKKAYKKLAKIYHPDKQTGNTEQFQKIHNAYYILINDSTRLKYDEMKKPTKNKLTNFLEDLLKNNYLKQPDLKKFFRLNEIDLKNIIENIESYDFNDLIGLFNNNLIPNKQKCTIDCSDTETPYWDEISAEYYSINNLPIKYHMYNKNNIKLELKCSLEEVEKGNIRKIKIKRKQNEQFIETSFYFKCSHPIIIFNNGGDNDGHLIINLSLPNKYNWDNSNIYFNMNINLYEYIYGININNLIKINNYRAYKNGNIINIKYIDKYMLSIKLNIIFNDNEKNKEILKSIY